MKTPRRSFMMWVAVALVAGVVFLIGAFVLAPPLIEKGQNSFEVATPPPVSARAQTLHRQLLIADLHSDHLLWARDPLSRSDYGHTDVPRLIEGNVALQVYSAVTEVPSVRDYHRTESGTDLIFWLALIQRWPPSTWASNAERALHQAVRLHDAEARSAGRLTLVETSSGLETYLARREREHDITAGVLAIEGLHALDGKIENVDRLFEAGYRIMGLAHFIDNEVAGSAHGLAKGGLSNFGQRVVSRMEALSVVMDLAHASPQAIEDVLDRATRPVIVSHTGVMGTCSGPRNLTDEQIRRIADGGGVIGIGLFKSAICDVEPQSFARAVRYVADLVGVEHVALGSDFDGSVHTKFDVTGLPHVTESLLSAGFSEEEIGHLMGGNVLRLLGELLPRESRHQGGGPGR